MGYPLSTPSIIAYLKALSVQKGRTIYQSMSHLMKCVLTILVYLGVKHSVSLLSCSVTEWVTPGLPRMDLTRLLKPTKIGECLPQDDGTFKQLTKPSGPSVAP